LQRELLKIAAQTAAFLFRDRPAIGHATGKNILCVCVSVRLSLDVGPVY
jgi:hypothetical protein